MNALISHQRTLSEVHVSQGSKVVNLQLSENRRFLGLLGSEGSQT
jgi:hypothetical protein